MSQPNYCPYCGGNRLIHVVTKETPATDLYICEACHKAFPLPESDIAVAGADKALKDKTVEICLHAGLLHGIKYYVTEKSKGLTGERYSLKKAKEEVEDLLASRGLSGAVKKPSRNGCLWVVILLCIAVAAALYFFFVYR